MVMIDTDSYTAVKESVFPPAGIGTVYDADVDTADPPDSHLANESPEWAAAAPISNVSVLETLNGTEYETAFSDPILYVIAAPEGVDANVTVTVSVVNAKFAVNVTDEP
jgi:hypothetical protein